MKMADLKVASEAVTPSSVAPTRCPSPRGDFGRILECEWGALGYLVYIYIMHSIYTIIYKLLYIHVRPSNFPFG